METIRTNVTEHEPKLSRRETVLRDFVRFAWRATRGLTTAAESEGKELIRRMEESGRVSPEQSQYLVNQMSGRMNDSRHHFEETVSKSIDKVVMQMNEISTRELNSLNEQISNLERRLNDLSTRRG